MVTKGIPMRENIPNPAVRAFRSDGGEGCALALPSRQHELAPNELSTGWI